MKSDEILKQKCIDLEIANKNSLLSEKTLKDMICDMQKSTQALKGTQSQLVQSEKLATLGLLSAGIMHETKNPLGFITSNIVSLEEYLKSFSEILYATDVLKQAVEEDNFDKAIVEVQNIKRLEEKYNIKFIRNDIDKLVEQSKGGAERIMNLVQDLKIFVRKDDKVLELNNIEEILESVMTIVWNEIKYKAKLKKEYSGIPPVMCNAPQIGQVFMNFIINASQAIDGKGEIIIKTYVSDRYACVEISDTGCGIAKENMEKIFEPLFTTKEIGVGTGLGLSISYDIVKQHKGEIDVESELNKGTKFTIKLPLQEENVNKK